MKIHSTNDIDLICHFFDYNIIEEANTLCFFKFSGDRVIHVAELTCTQHADGSVIYNAGIIFTENKGEATAIEKSISSAKPVHWIPILLKHGFYALCPSGTDNVPQYTNETYDFLMDGKLTEKNLFSIKEHKGQFIIVFIWDLVINN
jgi:hypothetical protein